MESFISKQPNGLYCRVSTVVNCPIDWNMTAEDYIELCVKKAEKDAIDVLENYVKPFDEVVKKTYPPNMTVEKIVEMFKDMGYNPTEREIESWKVWEDDFKYGELLWRRLEKEHLRC